MNKNLKKIADEVTAMSEPGFESFIAEQFLSSKSDFEEQPCFSLTHKEFTVDVWQTKKGFEIVKSVIPGSKHAGKDFRKTLSKEETIEELNKMIKKFLD